jgi:hypothetical protein
VVVCVQRQRRIAVQLELARDDHGVGGFALIVAAAEALTPVWLVELDWTSQSFATTVLFVCRSIVPSEEGSSPSAQILRVPLSAAVADASRSVSAGVELAHDGLLVLSRDHPDAGAIPEDRGLNDGFAVPPAGLTSERTTLSATDPMRASVGYATASSLALASAAASAARFRTAAWPLQLA